MDYNSHDAHHQEKRKTYKKLMLTTWVKKRKDKQAEKSSIRIICFEFLA
jgi:hypothetical protein